jgi:choline dehydrogenase-like flavoprotein
MADASPDGHDDPFDYVIVGSGAGGGTLAARLAEAGMRVCVLEAGHDAREAPGNERMPDDYDVPGFHAFACENDAMRWDFHVRHYADEARQARDPKFDAARGGVLYPRAATLGGCTAHNAMIFMRPHDADWNRIAELTGDASWRAEAMQAYFERVEACHHRPAWRALRRLGIGATGHGWDGWLRTERRLQADALGDDQLVGLLAASARAFIGGLASPAGSAWRWLRGGAGDPNARPRGGGSFEGLCYLPLSTAHARRTGTRERLLDVARRHPDRLHIETDALATRVLFDPAGQACGVEYLKGPRLYRAHASVNASPGLRCEAHARREVILCGGAFNTPQLLMLSGIGPAAELRAHAIRQRIDLPGVGANLQDRYEVALTHRMRQPWSVLEGGRFARGDPLWRRWQAAGAGLYASSGAALGLVRRSEAGQPGSQEAAHQAGRPSSQDPASRPSSHDPAGRPDPDIFCMALPAHFEGYARGFSNAVRDHADRLTWAVLKAHTANRAGAVTLRSADPRDSPLIHFRYFEEGDDRAGHDLRAVVEAIRFVRRLTAPLLASGSIAEELAPGASVQSDEALADYVRATAWGHHASCSCAIGPVAQGGVLGSDFAVHGTRRLRVVDASVFPRIPGFFIACAVYMVGEKAADAILRTAATTEAATVPARTF